MTLEIGNRHTPRIAVTIGDPAGIGPEIVLKAAASPDLRGVCLLALVGDSAELRRQAGALNLKCDYPIVHNATELQGNSADVVVVDLNNLKGPIEFGETAATSGRAALDFVEHAARLAMAGQVDAITNAPINKEAIKLAGSPFPGHTEMLASLCGAPKPLMAFFAGDLAVILLTVHLSLADAIARVTKQNLQSTLLLAHAELRRFGKANPKIAVCGLNPHAGENGLFGDEERREMVPAIEECRRQGVKAFGPFPADTLFVRAFRGEFDAVIACYHDQGLIPVKCVAFGHSAQATLGLPIIRTSVDHGTAFDIAGKGIADAGSLIEAITLAVKLVHAQSDTAVGR